MEKVTETGRNVFQTGIYTVINDRGDADPVSMEAALKELGIYPGRRIAVLGEIPDLGGITWAEHYRIGRIAAENADVVYAVGPNANRIVGGAVTGGMNPVFARIFSTHEEMTAALKRLAKPGDVLLFKGGREMHLEQVLEAFLKEEK